jgi:hypothetical protein
MINISVFKKGLNEYLLNLSKDRQISILSNKSGMLLKKTLLDIANLDINFFKISDIELFFKKGVKKDNDRDNGIRENILSKINVLPEEYINDVNYGTKWNLLKTKWLKVLDELYNEPYDKIIVNKMAGRKYNYDFNVVYILQNKISNIKKLEFKYNGKSISKLPQFLQLTEHCEFIQQSYSEFYYHNYLTKHISLIEGLELLDKDIYLKLVKGTNYNSNPFFMTLKNAEDNKIVKAQINTLVNNSIKEYLELYGNTINILNVYNIIQSSQKDKVFILWNNNEFYLDRLDISSNIRYMNIKNNNTIVLEDLDNGHQYHLLLRWKNHKGVLNPAWQISLRKTVVKK